MAKVFWAAKEATAAGDKAAWIAGSLASHRTKFSRAVRTFDVGDGRNDGRDLRLVSLVHSPAYIQSLQAEGLPGAAGNARFSSPLAASSVSAVVAAAVEVGTRGGGTSSQIVGSLSGGMHHATLTTSRYGHIFNGLAVAATLPGHDRPVLLLDLDGSCGGGTASLISNLPDIRQLDIAVNDLDAYADTPNATLHVVSRAEQYVEVLREALRSLESLNPQGWLCIYSAGIDGWEHAERGLARMTAAILAERDRIVFEWCCGMGISTAYALGGGGPSAAMPMETVVALHRQTIETAVAVMRGHNKK